MDFCKFCLSVVLLTSVLFVSCTEEIPTEILSKKLFINSLDENISIFVSGDLSDTASYTIVARDTLSFEANCPNQGDGRYCNSLNLPEFPGYFAVRFANGRIAKYESNVCDSIGKDPSTSFQVAIGLPNTCGFTFTKVNGVSTLTYIIDSIDYKWAN